MFNLAKRRFALIMSAVFLFNSSAIFANESPQPIVKINTAYHCMSSRFIDGAYIPTYDIDGDVCVLAQDLKNYGFNIEWDAENRVVNISDGEVKVYTMTNPELLKQAVDNMIRVSLASDGKDDGIKGNVMSNNAEIIQEVKSHVKNYSQDHRSNRWPALAL